jgi:hypothetical protein
LSNRLFLLGIVVYIVDCLDKKYFKVFIVFCIITNYSKNKQFSVLLPVLQDYNIVQKLGTIVGNNTSINNTFCTVVEEYLFKKEEIEKDTVY